MYAQNPVASVSTPVGCRISVAVSSVEALMKTSEKPAMSAGREDRQRDADEHREPAVPERARDLLEPRRRLRDPGADRDEREREEHDRVGDDELEARLVELRQRSGP